MTSIRFPVPARLLSLNDRGHWSTRAKLVAEWRRAAWVAGYNEQSRPPLSALVTVTLPVKDRRRRDPHNFVATVKPIIDGLVDARWWPDDTPAYLSVAEPVLEVGGQWVIVTAEARR